MEHRTLSSIINDAAVAAGLGPAGSTYQNDVPPGPKKLQQFRHCLRLQDTPALYSQDGQGMAAIARVKFFDPSGSATWFITEWDPATNEAFGWCELFPGGGELGYVPIDALANLPGRLGIGLELDMYWAPRPLHEALSGRD